MAKIRVVFKTPDAVDMAVQEAVQENTPVDIQDQAAEQIKKSLEKFVRWGEQITVEFDTEAGTATVIPL